MKRMIGFIQRYIPRRRRRQWRYVSGRRHRVGLTLFAAIIVIAYAWWFFTNDRRIELYAEGYLQSLTGARVRIGQARFRIFSGIHLSDVRIYNRTPAGREDLFQAREIYMRLRPLGLLTGQGISVSEVVCIEPVPTLRLHGQTWSWQGDSTSSAMQSLHGRLPVLRLRNLRLRFVDDQPSGDFSLSMPMNIVAMPREQAGVYDFSIEPATPEPDSLMGGRGVFNFVSGQIAFDGWVPLEDIDLLLPQYRQWHQRYQLAGQVALTLRHGLQDEQEGIVVNLNNVSMTLPPEEGGLELAELVGELAFTRQGLHIERLHGRLPQVGGHISIQGHFQGYDLQSPFRIRIDGERIILPLPLSSSDPFGALIVPFQRRLGPEGPLSASIALHRSHPGGEVEVSGVINPRNLSLNSPDLPLPVSRLQGAVEIAGRRMLLHNLTGLFGNASFSANGHLDFSGEPTFDVHFAATELPMTDDLRDALPENVRRIYDQFSPRGLCNLEARLLLNDDGKIQKEILLTFDGRASGEFDDFPYRLEQVSGQIHVTDDDAEIRSITGTHESGRAVINGQVIQVGQHHETIVTINAENIPLDDHLFRALPESAKQSYQSFNPSGRADMTGTFHVPPGGELDFEMLITLADGKISYDGFPYPVEDAAGLLVITPRSVEVRQFAARRGDSIVTASGQVDIDVRPAKCDLLFQAANVALDDDMRKALPKGVADIWDLLSPSGRADFSFHLLPDQPDGGIDYILSIEAKGMNVRYKPFPYPVSDLFGRVRAVPGRVELDNLASRRDDCLLSISGAIITDDAGHHTELEIDAKSLPINDTLLTAIPPQLAAITRHFRPGGQCNVQIRRLHYQSSADSPGQRWLIDGQIGFVNAEGASGFERMTGKIDGFAECDEAGRFNTIDASMNLVELVLNERRLTRVSGSISKDPDEPLIVLDDLVADAYGGRIVGLAEMAPGTPGQYGLSLTVEGIQIDSLLNTNPDEPRAEGFGRLAGTFQMTGNFQQPDSRRASGLLHISQAQTYRLPVLWGLLQVAMLQLPGDYLFNSGQIAYHMKGNHVVLEQVYLYGPSASLLGGGSIQLPEGRINLNFVSGPSRLVPNVFSQLLQITTQGLFQVRVTGTLRKPQMESRPLNSVNDLLQELITPK